MAKTFGTVYIIDMLGCGLSYLPMRCIKNRNPNGLMQVSVQGLEVWRETLDVDKFILVAHSIGCVHSVAYCEKYPQRVEQLVLLSPAGVLYKKDISFQRQILKLCYKNGISIGTLPNVVLSKMLKDSSKILVDKQDERAVFYRYHYAYIRLQGYGEKSLFGLIDGQGNAARKSIALSHRIPLLQVQTVSFIFGDNKLDFIDVSAGHVTRRKCQMFNNNKTRGKDGKVAPAIFLYRMENSRHAFMYSWEYFHKTLLLAIETGR